MFSPRTQLILKLVVEDYIDSAEPVGSKYLNSEYQIGVSDATVRNELASLEKQGYLRRPHTSSGRVPTETAYLYYMQHLRNKAFVLAGTPLKQTKDSSRESEVALKNLAKRLAKLSGETAIVAFSPRSSYYVGVSNLFGKPDFQTLEHIRSLSGLVDQFDDVIQMIYESVEEEPTIFIGSNNPFGPQMTTIVARYRVGDTEGLVGLIGPLRMNYSRNLALVERATEIINQL
jgi:transcriptional regulator of heat shock response